MPEFVDAWKAAWKMHAFRRETLISVVTLLVALVVMELYLPLIEARQGVAFADPLVGLLPPRDVHWITYSIVYSAALFGLISLSLYPFALLLTARALIVMIILRFVCLFLLPLDPPAGNIPLTDPFMSYLGIPATTVRALFFAWPVAILSLLAYTAQWRDLKIIFSVAAVVASCLLLVQHAHYTIDLVAAPVFAQAAVAIARWRTMGDAGAIVAPKAPSSRT